MDVSFKFERVGAAYLVLDGQSTGSLYAYQTSNGEITAMSQLFHP
jgi:hypothetical protein